MSAPSSYYGYMISNEQGQVQAPYGTTSAAGGRFNSYGGMAASGRYDHNASRLSDSGSVNASNSQSTMNSYYGGPGTTTNSSAMKSSYNPSYGAYSQPRPLPAPPPPPANFKVSANPTVLPRGTPANPAIATVRGVSAAVSASSCGGGNAGGASTTSTSSIMIPRPPPQTSAAAAIAGLSAASTTNQAGGFPATSHELACSIAHNAERAKQSSAQRETPLTHAEMNLVKKCGNTLRALQVLDFEGKEFVGLFFPRDNYVDLVNYSILYTAAMRNATAAAVTTVATISATANLELVKPNQIAALSAHTTGKLLECDQYEASESDARWTTFCATALVELTARRAHQSATQAQELARLREQQLRNLRNGYAVHKNLCHNFVPADVQYCVQLIQHLYRTIHADDRDPQVARRFVWLANTIHATLQEDSGSVLSLLQSYRDHFFGNRRVETYGRELTELVVDQVYLLPHEAQQVAALLLLDAIRVGLWLLPLTQQTSTTSSSSTSTSTTSTSSSQAPKTNLCLGLHVFFQLGGYFECVQMSETAAKIAEVGYRHCLVGAPSGHAVLKNSGNGAGGMKKVLVGGLQHHLVNVNRGNHSGSPLISPHFQQIPPVAASETSNVIAVVGGGRGSSTSPPASTGGTGAPGDHAVESDCDVVTSNNTNTNYTPTRSDMIQLDAVSKLRASCSRGFQRPGILFPLLTARPFWSRREVMELYNRADNCFDANGTLITPGNLAEDFGSDWISELETTGYHLIKRELAAWERKHYAYSDSVAAQEDHSDFGKNAFAAATRTSTGEKNSTSPPLLKYNNMLGAKKFCRTDPDATQYEDVGGSHRVSGQTDSNVLGTGRWREIVLFNGTTGGGNNKQENSTLAARDGQHPHHSSCGGAGNGHQEIQGGGGVIQAEGIGALSETRSYLRKLIPDYVRMAEQNEGEIIISELAPHSHILPHCAPNNLRLTAHLGLAIPNTRRLTAAELCEQRLGGPITADDTTLPRSPDFHPQRTSSSAGEVALSSGGDSCKNANHFLHSTTVLEFQAGKVAADPPFQSVEQKKLEKKKRVDDYKRQLFGDPSLSNRNTTLNCLSQHSGTSTRSSGILDQNGNPTTGRYGNNGQPQSGTSKQQEVDPRVDQQLHQQPPGGNIKKANVPFSQQPEGVCAIRVGRDWKQWEQGKVLLFDDSFEHEVVNKTPERRVILLIRFWHPQIDSRSLEELDRPPLEKLEKIKAAEKKKLEKALQEKIEEIHSGQVWKVPGAGSGQHGGEVLAEKKKTTEHKIKEQEEELVVVDPTFADDEKQDAVTPASSVAAASAAAATDAAVTASAASVVSLDVPTTTTSSTSPPSTPAAVAGDDVETSEVILPAAAKRSLENLTLAKLGTQAAVKAGLQRVLKYLMEVVKSHRLRLLPDEKLMLQQLQMRTRNPEDHNKELVSDLRVFLLSLVERLEGRMEAAASSSDGVFDTSLTQEEANRSPEKTKQVAPAVCGGGGGGGDDRDAVEAKHSQDIRGEAEDPSSTAGGAPALPLAAAAPEEGTAQRQTATPEELAPEVTGRPAAAGTPLTAEEESGGDTSPEVHVESRKKKFTMSSPEVHVETTERTQTAPTSSDSSTAPPGSLSLHTSSASSVFSPTQLHDPPKEQQLPQHSSVAPHPPTTKSSTTASTTSALSQLQTKQSSAIQFPPALREPVVKLHHSTYMKWDDYLFNRMQYELLTPPVADEKLERILFHLHYWNHEQCEGVLDPTNEKHARMLADSSYHKCPICRTVLPPEKQGFDACVAYIAQTKEGKDVPNLVSGGGDLNKGGPHVHQQPNNMDARIFFPCCGTAISRKVLNHAAAGVQLTPSCATQHADPRRFHVAAGPSGAAGYTTSCATQHADPRRLHVAAGPSGAAGYTTYQARAMSTLGGPILSSEGHGASRRGGA